MKIIFVWASIILVLVLIIMEASKKYAIKKYNHRKK